MITDDGEVPLSRPITVVIADDDSHLRDLLRLRLDLDGRFVVVGEAADGVQAVEVLRARRPDAVVLDVGMPRMTGLEVVTQVRRELPDTRIVLFTSLLDPALIEAADAQGADAYLDKGDIVGALIPTIVSLVHGDPVG
ncbi:MAG: response regulator transcription factor [Actinobacteria bacterium]|nr:response regulator transcription factor [Actinomycetota bacterium]